MSPKPHHLESGMYIESPRKTSRKVSVFTLIQILWAIKQYISDLYAWCGVYVWDVCTHVWVCYVSVLMWGAVQNKVK